MPILQQLSASEVTTVREVIDQLAEYYADTPFLISPRTQKPVTYGGLHACAKVLSRRFLHMGLTKGEKIAFLLENGLFSPQLLLGAMYSGFVPVPVNTVAGAAQVAYVLNHCDATVVFVSDEYQAMLSSLSQHVERPLHIIVAHPDQGPDWDQSETTTVPLPAVDGDDDGLLVYTSGSTGNSKGVLFSQQSLLLNGLNTSSVYSLSPRDRSLCVLPLYHMNAIITTLFSSLLSGGSVVIPHQFSVAHFWEWIADYHCTWSAIVPTIVSHLVNWTDPYNEGKAERLQQIRFVRSSSAPLAPSLHRAFEEKFPVPLIEGMGMTEASTIFMNPPSRDQRRIGSPGLPCHEMQIVDPYGYRVPTGHAGEILIRGPRLMKGYYKNPEATAEVLSPHGWLRTGDLGYQDEDGYVFIVGRAKEIVIKGGENIAPREIDEALIQHPAVLEAAAVGVPDTYLGEDLVAYVVLKPESQCSAQELLTHCVSILGEFKTPSRIWCVEDLPKGPSGKVQRLKLREQHPQPAALPRPMTAPPSHEDPHDQQQFEIAASRRAVEKQLAVIWENVLQRSLIGVHDNFFALGGHSLLAAGILARVRAAYHVSLPLRMLFEAPTISALAEHIEATRYTENSIHEPPVQSSPLHRELPLSYAQQRLWFLEQFNPHTATYNIPFVFRLFGSLNLAALQQALNALVERHAIFRTTFTSTDGHPQQSIADHVPFSVPVVDLSSWPEALRETEALRCAREEIQRPFDLARGPLMRVRVVRRALNDYLLIIAWHHIVIDGWSLGVFARELRALYEAFSHGRPPTLPALPLQYADFAVWQRQWVQGEAITQQIAYWKKQLAGMPALLQLPSDHPRPAQQTYSGTRLTFPISPSLTAALQHLSRQEGATLYITLLAAFQVLLSRYTGEEDIAVGSPIAGRVRPELEGLIGFFVNTLVLRTPVLHSSTFRALLHHVRNIALDAYAHQDVPFEQLVDELHVARALAYSPVVQVLFALQNVPRHSIELSGIITEQMIVPRDTAKFDLSLLVWGNGNELRGELEYNTDLFEESTILRLIRHYQTLLENIVANPDQAVATIPLLTSEEQHQLLVSWNETAQTYDDTLCLHHLFEKQVAQTPDALAVIHEDQQLTYRDLNSRANQLAHHLQQLGVGPETRVGLCMERSLEMLVAILAILKAGGAYVPLDPTYPSDRIAFILRDSQASLVVIQQQLQDRTPPLELPMLYLDTDHESFRAASETNPTSSVTANNLAYVLYTSGSTGIPKGVAVEHCNTVAFLAWATSTFSSGELAGVLASTSICFDLSIFEMFAPLACGGTVILADNALALTSLPHASRVTLLNMVPSAMRELLRLRAIPSSVQVINLAGEPLRTELVRDLYASTSVHKVYDLYGPTECTTYSTWTLRSADGPQTIGRPIANTQVYILDAQRNPVPIGVGGELYIGGSGVAREYLHHPELTAERFIADPFSSQSNARLYRTGDLARYLPDGNIEFLGRSDHQVKIRGYRIELGEIEIVLQQHPAIQDAVAIMREDTSEDKQLVAYVVARKLGAPGHQELTSYLRQKLPDYMVPAVFVMLDALPLTPNGKVDRSALPAPEQRSPEFAESFVAPRTPLEERIAAVWCDVLGIEHVGIHDNFFALGGHSLKVMQVLARLQTALQVELTVRRFFESPTIASLATFLDTLYASPASRDDLERLVHEIESLTQEEAAQAIAQLQNSSS